MAGMEVGWGVLGGEDADAGREQVVEGAEEVSGGNGGGQGEGGDLAEGVDAGVGAARALGQDALLGDAVKGVAEGALDGGQSRLDLPAMVGGSVVGEGKFPVGHDPLDGITGSASSGRFISRRLAASYAGRIGDGVREGLVYSKVIGTSWEEAAGTWQAPET